MQSKQFRKTFKNHAALDLWLEKHDGDVDIKAVCDLGEECCQARGGIHDATCTRTTKILSSAK